PASRVCHWLRNCRISANSAASANGPLGSVGSASPRSASNRHYVPGRTSGTLNQLIVLPMGKARADNPAPPRFAGLKDGRVTRTRQVIEPDRSNVAACILDGATAWRRGNGPGAVVSQWCWTAGLRPGSRDLGRQLGARSGIPGVCAGQGAAAVAAA